MGKAGSGWGSAWAWAAIRLPESRRIPVCPDWLAGGQLVAGDDLVGTMLLFGVKAIAVDRKG
jgi:hypothetical protein